MQNGQEQPFLNNMMNAAGWMALLAMILVAGDVYNSTHDYAWDWSHRKYGAELALVIFPALYIVGYIVMFFAMRAFWVSSVGTLIMVIIQKLPII